MKKILLLSLIFLSLGSNRAKADSVISYEPDEIKTSIAEGDIVAIYNATDDKYLYGSGAQNLGYDVASNAFQTSNPGWLFKVEKYDGHFLFRLQKVSGGDYDFMNDSKNSYLNSQPANGWCSFILSLYHNDVLVYGQDGENLALWDLEASGNGFKLKNFGTGLYLNNAGTANNAEANAVVWTLCTLKEVEHENSITQGLYDATDAQELDFNNFVSFGGTWDPETKSFTGKCGFQWTGDGLDMNHYQYIVLTLAKNMPIGGAEASIKDKSNVSVTGDQYGVDCMNMWFGEWNHHNCMTIDVEKLRVSKEFDLHHISELTINAPDDGVTLANAYLTNQKPNNDKNWNGEDAGDFSVSSGIAVDKFGTICLNFPAAVAGALIYQISGKTASSISLSQYTGLLEAGKPYFFKTIASNDAGKAPKAVRFYKATASTVASPVDNNGLIGRFTAITAPVGANYYVLSNNKLYQVNSNVTVGANKAYIDVDQITNSSSTKARVNLFFDGADETTGIENLDAIETLTSGKIYDLSGRVVTAPTKGMYIINGKKVLVK